jgi:hypothetical protein
VVLAVSQPVTQAELQLAERVRQACVQALLEGYQMAAMSGLCHQGAFDVAVDAVRSMDLREVVGVSECQVRPALGPV